MICIFDTETTSLDKPFCYNIGYIIVDDNGAIVLKKDFVVEQVWHNEMLFTTAYYAEKRKIYVMRMRSHMAIMDKFGYLCRTMARDFKNFNVTSAYAYNSDFDERVFDFNCDWYKCSNPFDNIPIYDIRGYVHNFIAFNSDFQNFCDENKYYTTTGNYSTTAETLFRYITKNLEFSEEHTALADSEIEKEILFYCLNCGAELETRYQVYVSIPRKILKPFSVYLNGERVFECEYISRRNTEKGDKVNLKNE